jgi:hypothetical protein
VAFHHLRRGLEAAVHAVQRVEHHVGVVPRDIGKGEGRIEIDEIDLRDEAQGRLRLCSYESGRGEQRRGGQCGLEQGAAAHW